MSRNTNKGVSLAKGPVGLIGLALLAYGITAFIFGGHSFSAHPLDGTVNGKTWLGLEVNAWSSLLFVGSGALLLLAAPMHWAAKSVSLIVGLVLAAASLIALYDKQDVLGIFAANGLTKLVWGAAGALLIVLSLLPRVGGKRKADEPPARRQPAPRQTPADEREPVRSDRERASDGVGSRPAAGDREVLSSGSRDAHEGRRRQRERGEL